MLRTLVLTSDLPFFPGRNGHDFFNLRQLATEAEVGLVGPEYPHFPAEGMRNLESFLQTAAFWPRPAPPAVLPEFRKLPGHLAGWLKRLPATWRLSLLERMLGLRGQPAGALEKLILLSHCAPQLVAALQATPWQSVVLVQSGLAPWLDYLPRHLARLVYFHDVRSHFAVRQAALGQPGEDPAAVRAQEQRVAAEADGLAFVSDLDASRALELLRPETEMGVAPIPVDADYFTPRPASFARSGREIVLFTGHLAHPPNVDAVVWFLRDVWPLLRARRPQAVFQAVGQQPAPAVAAAIAAAAQAELHADVPDIRPYFWDAAAYVVPMRFGGGVRQKIVESCLQHVPVVSTTMGLEGLRPEIAAHGRAADTPEALAAELAALLESAPAAECLAAARAAALAHHAIPVAAASFTHLVRRSVQRKRQRPFKILFDLRWMSIGHAGGIEQMAYELVDALAHLDTENTYRLHGPRRTFLEWDLPPNFRRGARFSDKLERRAEALFAGTVNGLATSLGHPPLLNPEMRALRHWRRLDFDLVHSLNNVIQPDLRSFPNILTGIDLQHVHHPEFFSPEDWRVREETYRASVQAARHIVPISEFTRQDLHRSYGVPLEKMTTVGLIPSRSAWLPLPPREARRHWQKLGVEEGRYFLYPAHSWPHKNHARLVRAFAQAAPELPAGFQLVLTGRPFESDHPARQLSADLGPGVRVRHLGYCTPLEMRALYAGAAGLVFPSLFEGFGLPVAEAIIAGCPVACAHSTSLPEIAGPAALLFDPLDPAAISQALIQLATDSGLRAELLAEGRSRRDLFTPEASARKMLSVYRRTFDEYYSD